MKLLRPSLLSATSLLIGGIIGASTLVALAWDSAPVGGPPPNPCPSTTEGCNAPINVGGTAQTKSGWLSLTNGLITSNLQLLNGPAVTSDANGLSLVSDANGNATWGGAGAVKATGRVHWGESISQSGVAFTCYNQDSLGVGSCAGSYPANLVHCSDGSSILDTVQKITYLSPVEVIDHYGYCIRVIYP